MPLLPSILDRLIKPQARIFTIDDIVEAIYRDLEDLFNTRQESLDIPREFTEIHNSMLAYGLPDLTSFNASTPQQKENIGRILEKAIIQFEPRLTDVRAILEEKGNDGKLLFHIAARLRAKPAPSVPFETILELTTGHYKVRPADVQ